MLAEIIKKQFKIMEERSWEKIFWAIDFHGTISPPTYTQDDGDSEFYPYAVEALQALTKRDDCCLIMWTSSYPEYLEKHLQRMRDLDIHFDYFNKNPDCPSTEICDFSGKFYFNVLIDDKAGFLPEKHWKEVLDALD